MENDTIYCEKCPYCGKELTYGTICPDCAVKYLGEPDMENEDGSTGISE